MTDEKKKPPVTNASLGPTTDSTNTVDSIGTWQGNPKLRKVLSASRNSDSAETKEE